MIQTIRMSPTKPHAPGEPRCLAVGQPLRCEKRWEDALAGRCGSDAVSASARHSR